MTSEASQRFARLRNGLWLLVDPTEYIGRIVALTGDYDSKITRLCERALRPGDGVLDIGANCGLVTIFSAARVGPYGRVHAFEPQPRLAEMISASARRNGLTNVSVHACALSDREEEATLHVPTDNAGGASLARRGDHASRRTVVRLRDAGSMLEALDPPGLALVKIDVEGHEGVILASARSFLAARRPPLVVFESHPGDAPFFERAEVATLVGLGYSIFQIDKTLLRLRLRRVDPASADLRAGYDFVAILDDAMGSDRLRPLRGAMRRSL